jgi:hypothetical protein
MRHHLVVCTLACLGAALPATRAAAQAIPPDGIYTTANPKKPRYPDFVIASESPRGLVLKSPKADIPADQIDDIIFPLNPVGIRVSTYRLGIIAEKKGRAAAKPADRAKEYAEALGKYEETLDKLAEGQPYAKAHLEYKIAYLLYTQGRDEGKEATLAQAAAKLKAFKTAHPQAWQLVRVLKMLAQLQLDARKYAEAEQAFRDLAKSDAPEDVRQDAEVQALLVALQLGSALQGEGKELAAAGKGKEAEAKVAEAKKQFAEVQGKLQALVGTLRAGSAPQMRARLALAECLGVAHDLAKAKAEVKTVLDQTKEKALRALAYNTLGYCYWLNEQWQDARWEFLWVDVIYNQDPREHARALYYLADIFGRLGEGDRARECREQLLTDRQFNGLEYQRRALKDEKAP